MFNQRAIRLKKKLTAGEYSSGIWVSLPSPTACEVIAGAGLDWIVVDAEHSPFNPETLQHMLMAFKDSDTVPIIRVPWNDQVMIKQALDMGWDGIVVPQTNSVDEAQCAVSACRYPPLGKRGFGPRRAGNYYRDQDKYVRLANESVFCIIQIEDVAGAETIDEIVKVPGIDGIFVGRFDMSGTTEKFGDVGTPEVCQAVQKIFNTARAAGIPAGNGIDTSKKYEKSEEVEENMKMGCQLIILGEDTGFLKIAMDSAVKVFKEVIKSSGDKVTK